MLSFDELLDDKSLILRFIVPLILYKHPKCETSIISFFLFSPILLKLPKKSIEQALLIEDPHLYLLAPTAVTENTH